MSNVIKLKRGTGSDPSASDLVLGEIAIRTDTGKLFTKKDNGTVAEISGSGGGGSDIFINTLSSSSGSGGGSASFNGSATRFTLSNPPDVSAQQLLVSINGVIQKPNSGTSPSEGFALDGTDIIFAAAPATGADFFIITYGSIGLSVPADNSVTSAKIVNGTIVGTDLATNIDLVDNQKIRFGTGNDLQIYHDGSYSRIHSANHELLIRAGGVFNISNGDGTENLLRATVNGSVELYHDNSKKLETTANGLYITGAAVFPDGSSNGIQIGNSSDLQIYHDGTNSYIKNLTGYLNVNANLLYLGNQANNETYILAQQNGSVNLYYDNSKKFETDTNGITVTGRVLASGTSNIGFAGLDNVKLSLGTSDDLKIHHDGSNSYIDNNTGALNIRSLGSGANVQIIADNDYMARFVNDGAVELYYDNTKMFRTYASGVIGDQNIWVGSDNYKLLVGGSADLQIYHNGTHSFIDENQNGNLVLRTNPSGTYAALVLQAGQENSVICHKNGNVELYYDNAKKLETTSVGINVSGNTSKFNSSGSTNLVIGSTDAGGAYLVLDGDSNGDAIGGDYAYLVHATDGDLEIHCDNPNGDSRFELYVGNGATQALIAEAAGAVKLYHDNTQRFETVSNGFRLAHSTGNVDFHFNRLIVNAGQTFFIDHTATGADFQIRTSDSSGLDTTALQILGSGCLYNRCRSGSQANLTLRKQLTGADGIDYLQTRNQNNNLRTAIKGNGGISNYQSNDTNLSDETMKKNIVDCESIIEKFKQWKLRKFNYNSDVDGTPLTYGLIAQEIETLHSDLVSADFPVYESGEEVMKKTVKDHQLMMLSFKALQEAIAKIEVLETEVAALKAA